jgi:hypothetical protein
MTTNKENHMHLLFIPVVLSWLLIFTTIAAVAAPVTTIRNNGSPHNRVDIAILSEGYRFDQMGQYAADVDTLVTGLFAQQPWNEYQRYVNVHRIDIGSPEAGADHPEYGSYKNTAFGATYYCAGVPQLICVDVNAVMFHAADSIEPAKRDILIVLVNDDTYGGSGGAVAVVSRHSSSVELNLHELGHSFGLLADEYSALGNPPCDNTQEPPEPNVLNQDWYRWVHWISPTTPFPTSPSSANGSAGWYEGAKYCDYYLYRPTPNSKMRSLGRPYESINQEQLVKRLYVYVDPIDAFVPGESYVVVPQGVDFWMGVATPAPMTHALTTWWFVNGGSFSDQPVWTVNTTGVAPGAYYVEVYVFDQTSWVQSDPQRVLVSHRAWTVQVVQTLAED